ncbi:MAG: hypothetical protein ACPLRW_02490 [Moorellales bacterium]
MLRLWMYLLLPYLRKTKPLARGVRQIYKAVIRYSLIVQGRKIAGVDPNSRRIEYLPVDEEGRKSLDRFVGWLAEGVRHGMNEPGPMFDERG